ncbi:hypothetical protein AA0311_2187 [Asaia bogorensis NBRC 16594]|nr:hypothetical protein AA0311_2187 [Asaia bogorensis NBRC 16594]
MVPRARLASLSFPVRAGDMALRIVTRDDIIPCPPGDDSVVAGFTLRQSIRRQGYAKCRNEDDSGARQAHPTTWVANVSHSLIVGIKRYVTKP